MSSLPRHLVSASPCLFRGVVRRGSEFELVGDQAEQEFRLLRQGGRHDVVREDSVAVGFHIAREGACKLGVDLIEPPRGGLVDRREQLPYSRSVPGEPCEVGELSGGLGGHDGQTFHQSEGFGGVPVQEHTACFGEFVDQNPVGDGHHHMGRVTDHPDTAVELGGQVVIGKGFQIQGQCPMRFLLMQGTPFLGPTSDDSGGKVRGDCTPGGADAAADRRMQPHQHFQHPARRRVGTAAAGRGRSNWDHSAIDPTADGGGLNSL